MTTETKYMTEVTVTVRRCGLTAGLPVLAEADLARVINGYCEGIYVYTRYDVADNMEVCAFIIDAPTESLLSMREGTARNYIRGIVNGYLAGRFGRTSGLMAELRARSVTEVPEGFKVNGGED